MATTNSTVPENTPRYTLPDAQRQAILVLSYRSIQTAKIERQRLAFIALYGDEFGIEQDAH
jgi:hypothetical protein